MNINSNIEKHLETKYCRYGIISFFKNDIYIGRSLDEYGEWAQIELDFLLQFIRPGDVVIDIGAFIGTHSIAFGQKVGPKGKVIAIEPQNNAFQVLKKNIEQNNLTNIKIFKKAVSNISGTILIEQPDLDNDVNLASFTLAGITPDKDSKSKHKQNIDVIILDQIISGSCDLIKIDVEGMEILVLEGAADTLRNSRPLVFAECLSVQDGWNMVEFMQKNNFVAYLHNELSFNPNNFRQSMNNIFGMARETNIIFIPEEKLSTLRKAGNYFDGCIEIHKIDDLVLGLLKKPQYKDDVLSWTTAAKIFGNTFWANEQELFAKNNVLEKHTGEIALLEKMVQSKNQEISLLQDLVATKNLYVESIIREKETEQARLRELLSTVNVENIKLQGINSSTQNELNSLKELHAATNSQLAALMEGNNRKADELANAKNQLLATQTTIQRKDQELRAAVSFMEELNRSKGWRLVGRYRSLLDRLVPAGSFRRRVYSLPFKLYRRIRKNPVQQPLPVPQGVDSHSGVEQPDPTELRTGVNRKLSAVCTIASKNYLGMVRVFAESMKRTNPGIPVYVLLVDEVENKFDPVGESFHLISIGELDNIPDPQQLFFKYNPIELNTAVKPYFLEYLFIQYHLEKVCYFDPDICIFSRLDGLWDLLANQAMVVTPHITTPYSDDHHPSEIEINLAGVFNLGFIGVSNVPVTADFLRWWKNRMHDYCYMNPSAGMHVDQNWVNFAPAMHDGVFILRDPAYNIAYWNLHERGNRLRFDEEKLYIDDRPAAFFHFSGLDPIDIEAISKHQDRYRLSDFPLLRPLFEYYRDQLNSRDQERIRQWRYAYNEFDNGIKIPQVARSLYSQLGYEQMQRFGNPFSASGVNSYYSWINQPGEGSTSSMQPVLTRLHMEIYRSRPDLQKAFPEPLGGDRERYAYWFRENGTNEYNLDPVLLPEEAPSDPSKNSDRSPTRFPRRLVHDVLISVRQFLKGYLLRIFPKNSRFVNRLRDLDKKYYKKIVYTGFPSPNKAPQSPLPFGVNVAGYIHGEFGTAEGARASIRSLAAVNIPTAMNNVDTHVHRHEDFSFDNISDTNPYKVNLVHVNADQSHEFVNQKGRKYLFDRYNIGYWFWELSRFPEQWHSAFEYFHEIWVASKFTQESIARSSPIPVVKMTFPVKLDENQGVPNRTLFSLPEHKYLFGFMFDYLSLMERKNPFGLIEAFRNAFNQDDEVMLVIKTINSEYAPEKAALLQEGARGCNVRFIDRHVTPYEMSMLMASFDSFISLHRSEGFGIGMAQAMFLRKPVIATGYSGNMDFMDHNNSFLVRYKLVELEKDYGPYEKGNVWADPNLDHAAELMQLVVSNRPLAMKIAQRAETDVKSKMSFEITGQEMKARLLLVTKGRM